MPRQIPFESDSQPVPGTEPAATSTRREALGAGGVLLAALFGGDWFSFLSDEETSQLQDSGEAVIDLDDITGVDIRNGLSVDKDAGEITIDAQEVEDALLSVLDSGAEQSSTVDTLDFTDNLDVSGSGSTVQVSTTVAQELARVLDSGTETATGVTELDFTDGLDVTATTDGAQIAASGGGSLSVYESNSITAPDGKSYQSVTTELDHQFLYLASCATDLGGGQFWNFGTAHDDSVSGAAAGVATALIYNGTEWEIWIDNGTGGDVTFNYTILEPSP